MTAKNKKSMAQEWADSFLFSGNAEYLDAQYNAYLEDPHQVDANLKIYFDTLHKEAPAEVSHDEIKAYFQSLAKHPQQGTSAGGMSDKQFEVHEFIRAYRSYGHHKASLDPLNLMPHKQKKLLELETYGLSDSDMSTKFNAGNFAKLGEATLQDIYAHLQRIYAGSIGFEYMYISSATEAKWLRARIEDVDLYSTFSEHDKKIILNDLISANEFERYLANKYVGQKRFGLEGGDSLIPSLNHIVRIGGANPVEEIVIGMAHRGRLNVLANVIGKPIRDIIHEFDGLSDDELNAAISDPNHKMHSGDVKYHLGYSQDVKTSNGVAHMSLAFNPSHLEFVCPVVEGSVRARQTRRGESGHQEVLPILLHGDSAFAGQGIVMETLNMSLLPGYSTGGTLHIIINNQIGFTTSDPATTRSTDYCSDLAKMLEAPVFHVDGDDPEAVVFVTQLAYDYRMKFNKDVVIDLICFRRHGHNEADEPAATQPLMYKAIKKHQPTSKIYADKLIANGLITDEAYKASVADYLKKIDEGDSIPEIAPDHKMPFIMDWTPYLNKSLDQETDTSIPKAKLIKLAKKMDNALDDSIKLQPQVQKMLDKRKQMTEGSLPLNWGYAEMLAYLTLLDAGTPIRLSGEDCQRGTFAHRHAVLHNFETGETYEPVNIAAEGKAHMQIINSFLSEAGVLGFDYGYACSDPNTLVLWEAQFGDFVNGAQVIIDQFISSAEQKWDRLCGLVMLLPHGYEGMGPEHSSARLERFLQLCAEDNMQVCVPSTPAQIFHLLRRQVMRNCRKPLITITPKSLLRHPLAVSSLDDLADGQFQLVIPELDDIKPEKVDRIVLCAGKVYYDLLERRRKESIENVVIIRIEQLYPFPTEQVSALLKSYNNVKDIVWCQEEPQNQGAWYVMHDAFKAALTDEQVLSFAGRSASAAPAVGHAKLHKIQQTELVEQALNITEEKG